MNHFEIKGKLTDFKSSQTKTGKLYQRCKIRTASPDAEVEVALFESVTGEHTLRIGQEVHVSGFLQIRPWYDGERWKKFLSLVVNFCAVDGEVLYGERIPAGDCSSDAGRES